MGPAAEQDAIWGVGTADTNHLKVSPLDGLADLGEGQRGDTEADARHKETQWTWKR